MWCLFSRSYIFCVTLLRLVYCTLRHQAVYASSLLSSSQPFNLIVPAQPGMVQA